jgi:plastocyanin
LGAAIFGAGFLFVGRKAEEPASRSGRRPKDAPTAPMGAGTAEKVPDLRSGTSTGIFGTASVRGVVRFTGNAPRMAAPKNRKEHEFCKLKDVPYDGVVVRDGKLRDVLVRLAPSAVKGEYAPPAEPAVVEQADCMYTPHMRGAVAGQTLTVRNLDRTLHNIHTYRDGETWFNRAHPNGGDDVLRELPDEPKIVKLTCDIHPWMRAFVVVSPHPFFAVTGADGAFTIDRVPPGSYPVEAWHPHYGPKTARVEVGEGGAAVVDITYDGTEPEPRENRDELKGLF